MIANSMQHSPIRLTIPQLTADANTTSTALPVDAGVANSPRSKKKPEKEFPSQQSRMVSRPRGKPPTTPNRPGPVEIRFENAVKKTVDEPPPEPQSPRKYLESPVKALSGTKKKMEELVSPKTRLKHLFEDLQWTDLPGADPSDSNVALFGPMPVEPDSPPKSPLSGAKRKATDDPESRPQKRIRFQDEDYSKASESVPNNDDANEKANARLANAMKIDQLSKELQDWDSKRSDGAIISMPPEKWQETREAHQPPIHLDMLSFARINSKPSDDGKQADLPFKPNLLGKHAMKARERGKPWIEKASGDSVAGHLQRTLDQLIETNPGKINLAACALLQQLFGLLPAGARKVNSTFNYALSASFYSLGFNTREWSDIETLYRDFDQLDVSTCPKAGAEFKVQLKEIIAAKKGLMFLMTQEKNQTQEKAAEDSDA